MKTNWKEKILVMLVVLLFIIATALQSKGQSISRLKMDVQEVDFNGTVCNKDTIVLFGAKDDTLCFAFTSHNRCYFPVTDSALLKTKDKFRRQIIVGVSRDRYYKDRVLYILQDRHYEKYSIEFYLDKKEGGMIIFITNIDYGIPSFIMSTSQICR